jgi:hypothetical protein
MSEAGSQGQPDDALIDLLVKQVTESLPPAELRALDEMDGAVVSEYQRGFERAAAAISLAGAAPWSAPPPALKQRLEQQARSFYAAANAVPAEGAAPQAQGFKAASAAAAAPGRRSGGNAGWFAAAACLLLALAAWLRTPHQAGRPVADAPVLPASPAPPASPAAPTAAEERAALLAKAESLKVTLGPTKDPAAASLQADVVWDQATQQGFIRFVGLSRNDPRVHQYQIWIFDGVRDQRYPVDGGVFDIPVDVGEVVIPIRAALPVGKPAAFAVTLEKPGGVVVSARDHVLALGAVG